LPVHCHPDPERGEEEGFASALAVGRCSSQQLSIAAKKNGAAFKEGSPNSRLLFAVF